MGKMTEPLMEIELERLKIYAATGAIMSVEASKAWSARLLGAIEALRTERDQALAQVGVLREVLTALLDLSDQQDGDEGVDADAHDAAVRRGRKLLANLPASTTAYLARVKATEQEANLYKYLHSAVGECHLMISRNTAEYQTNTAWKPEELPARLQKMMRNCRTPGTIEVCSSCGDKAEDGHWAAQKSLAHWSHRREDGCIMMSCPLRKGSA